MNISSYFTRIFRGILLLLLVGIVFIAAGVGYVWYTLMPQLPDIRELRNIELQVPLRIYSQEGLSIAEYGDQRRTPLALVDVPPLMTKAILAAEDDQFYEHPGIDAKGLLRAALNVLKTGHVKQGASTITMQVARNFYLTREKTVTRKLKEMLLALQIEKELKKEDILELYLNKIFLGHRSYGFAAAAYTYYGQQLDELNLAQYAMLAGLPKAPSAYNPVRNAARALLRRNYVLRRMRELSYISEEAYREAVDAPVTATLHGFEQDLQANYVAEMVRDYMVQTYPKTAYIGGLKVYTTLRGDLQNAARHALNVALQEYDMRHGYRGAYAEVDLSGTPASEDEGVIFAFWDSLLEDKPSYGELLAALVLEVGDKNALVYTAAHGILDLNWDGIQWAKPYINDQRTGKSPKQATEVLQAGQVVHVYPLATQPVEQAEKEGEDTETSMTWRLAQIPQVSGALVSLNPEDGAILALQGGLDYHYSKFNRVVQAERQPGSNFKPFVYAAALEIGGKTPASLINDAPVIFSSAGKLWRPENYSHKSYGPTRLREALIHSRNLVSVRLLHEIGMKPVLEYVTRLGFPRERLPRDLTLALGSCSLTPLEVASGFAIFANGGFRVEPYFISRIEDYHGNTIYESHPKPICRECASLPLPPPIAKTPEQDEDTDTEVVNPDAVMNYAQQVAESPYAPRVMSAQTAWLMTSIMKDVIRQGTARRALKLQREDIAGKTGTTNEQRDAWFSGFNAELVTTAWVGFDTPRSLGRQETGGRAALPMWIEFMGKALAGHPTHDVARPSGLVTVRIDPQSGQLAPPGYPGAIFEHFPADNLPDSTISYDLPDFNNGNGSPNSFGDAPVYEQIF